MPRSLKICTAAGERASEMSTRGAMGYPLLMWAARSAQPAEHVRKGVDAARSGVLGLDGHAVTLQQRDAERAAAGEDFDQSLRSAFVAIRVEDHRRVEVEVTERGIGPGKRRHFVAGGRRQRRLDAFAGIGNCDMAGLVQQIARMRQARFVDEDGAVADGKARRKVGSGRSATRTVM